ncbi:MAG: hypothetical protein NZ585_11035 [Chloracidobacterium sp.]|nr:hypothetical protein [Chloracidobacterium sp.]MDW8218299.1 hypothetical protein [Acidobacteriota bacterium]
MPLPLVAGLAKIALPMLKGVAMNAVKGLAVSLISEGIRGALTNLVQRIGTSLLNGNNTNIAKNPPLGPFGRTTDFLGRTADFLGNFAQRLQSIADRLQRISSALTKFNEALKTLMDAVAGRDVVADKIRQANIASC